ncbi:DUF2599 domain-containing protein [Myceligenerans xiligouense]|uniref:Uncharacterized protein DUF2599 n=1 Tax=Myceligenerans xiligouense TaxID=253184 RepID=A0A3N4YQ91_9MICO|nr:DUF2599 domain-containing protein [Myceligenerans xiligouense]RPF23209.1 uncharacterized protein DUF2599 [Myceligenerans xiligouense]
MRASHVIVAAAAALVLAALVASRAELGEGGGDPAPTATSAGSQASPGRTGLATTPDPTPLERRTVTVAGVDLEITAAEVTVGDPGQEGTRRVTTSGAPTYTTATAGAKVVEHADESVTVLHDGTPVAALTRAAPRTTGESADTPSGTTALTLGDDALGSATWALREGEGGRSLAVVPEPWVRGGGEATLDLLGAQLAAAEPETGSDTMRDQLACHHLGAPDKASWNLEPWRPDVGMFGTIAARCNPADS